MALLSVTVHNAVGADSVVCNLYIVLHEHQHLYIIHSNNTFTLDIDKF